MNTQERYDDISRRSGLSEDIIRRVFNAEKESITESLKKGERATLIGRCTIKPEISSKLEVGCKLRKCIRLKAEVAQSLEASLEDLEGFIVDSDSEEIEEGIRINQISALI